jgi:hypothetical protein
MKEKIRILKRANDQLYKDQTNQVIEKNQVLIGKPHQLPKTKYNDFPKLKNQILRQSLPEQSYNDNNAYN